MIFYLNLIRSPLAIGKLDRAISKPVFEEGSPTFVIPEFGIDELLRVTEKVAIDIPIQQVDKRLWFICSMGMYTGETVSDQ